MAPPTPKAPEPPAVFDGSDSQSSTTEKSTVEAALAGLVADLAMDMREMLVAQERGVLTVLTQLVAEMATAKGKNDDAIRLLNDAMKQFEKWEAKNFKLQKDLKDRSHTAVALLAKVSGISESELAHLNARLSEAEDG